MKFNKLMIGIGFCQEVILFSGFGAFLTLGLLVHATIFYMLGLLTAYYVGLLIEKTAVNEFKTNG